MPKKIKASDAALQSLRHVKADLRKVQAQTEILLREKEEWTEESKRNEEKNVEVLRQLEKVRSELSLSDEDLRKTKDELSKKEIEIQSIQAMFASASSSASEQDANLNRLQAAIAAVGSDLLAENRQLVHTFLQQNMDDEQAESGLQKQMQYDDVAPDHEMGVASTELDPIASMLDISTDEVADLLRSSRPKARVKNKIIFQQQLEREERKVYAHHEKLLGQLLAAIGIAESQNQVQVMPEISVRIEPANISEIMREILEERLHLEIGNYRCPSLIEESEKKEKEAPKKYGDTSNDTEKHVVEINGSPSDSVEKALLRYQQMMDREKR